MCVATSEAGVRDSPRSARRSHTGRCYTRSRSRCPSRGGHSGLRVRRRRREKKVADRGTRLTHGARLADGAEARETSCRQHGYRCWRLGRDVQCSECEARQERGWRRAQFRASCRRSAAFRPNRIERTLSRSISHSDTRHSRARPSQSHATCCRDSPSWKLLARTLRSSRPPPPPRIRARFHPRRHRGLLLPLPRLRSVA